MAEEKSTQVVAPVTKKKSNVLMIVVIVILVLLAACGMIVPRIIGGAYKGFLRSKGIDFDGKNGSVNIKTNDGEVKIDGNSNTGSVKTNEGEYSYGENLSLPSDFPKNVPVMSGAKIVSSTTNTADGSSMIAFTLTGTAQDAYNYYKGEMPKNGWTEQSTYSGQMLTYTNDTQNAIIVVSANSDTNGCTVSITVSKK